MGQIKGQEATMVQPREAVGVLLEDQFSPKTSKLHRTVTYKAKRIGCLATR